MTQSIVLRPLPLGLTLGDTTYPRRARVACLAGMLLMTLALPGCATGIHGTRPYIAVDSQPRGEMVRVDDGHGDVETAVTPYLHKASIGARSVVHLTTADGLNAETSPCPLRWGTSVAGNAVLSVMYGINPMAFALFLGAQGVDYMTGAMHDCTRPAVLQVAAPAPKQSPTYCRRIILLPPLDLDTHLSDHLAREIAAGYGKGSTGCDSFVDYALGKEELEYFNINHYNRGDLSAIDRQRLYRLAYNLKATHALMTPSVSSSISAGHALGNLIDLQTMRAEAVYEVNLADDLRALPPPATGRKLYIYTLSLLPNALTYSRQTSFHLNGVGNAGQDLGAIKTSRARYSAYDLLSGIAFEHVDHPDGLSPWDYSTSLSPAFKMLVWDSTYTFKDSASASGTSDYNLHLRYFFLLAVGTFTVHSPFGAVSLGLGFGPAYGRGTDDHGHRHQSAFTATNADFYYTAFVNGRTFCRLGVELTSFNAQGMDASAYKVTGYYQTYAGIGLFLPSARSHAIEVLDR